MIQRAPSHTPLTLRLFEDADERQLRAWLTLAHVVEWWGGRAAAEASLALAASSETSVRCMIDCGEDVIGYGHGIDAQLTGGDLLRDVPHGAFEVDLFIADANYVGRGLGAAALELMASEIIATNFASAVLARMPVQTESAVRDLERRGFRWTSIDRTPGNPPRWVLVKSRTA